MELHRSVPFYIYTKVLTFAFFSINLCDKTLCSSYILGLPYQLEGLSDVCLLFLPQWHLSDLHSKYRC